MHCAVITGNEEFTRILLLAGTDKNILNSEGETPLSLAVRYGYTQIALMLYIQGERTPNPRVEHFLKTCRGYDDMREVLESIDSFLHLNDHNADGKTLLLAAASNGDTALVKYLLYKGSPINTQKNNGYTALHEAALNGDTKTVALLLSLEANFELSSNSGETPLHLAARAGNVGLVKLLLAKKADTKKRDTNGETPLFAAVTGNHVEVAELLLKHGAEIDAQRNDLYTPLCCTITNGNYAMADMLLGRNGASPFIPLHLAINMNRGKFVSLLLRYGEDLNAQATGGATPLMAAMPNLNIALQLIQAGADINKPADNGATPFSMAVEYGHIQIALILCLQAERTSSPNVEHFLETCQGYDDMSSSSR